MTQIGIVLYYGATRPLEVLQNLHTFDQIALFHCDVTLIRNYMIYGDIMRAL